MKKKIKSKKMKLSIKMVLKTKEGYAYVQVDDSHLIFNGIDHSVLTINLLLLKINLDFNSF